MDFSQINFEFAHIWDNSSKRTIVPMDLGQSAPERKTLSLHSKSVSSVYTDLGRTSKENNNQTT